MCKAKLDCEKYTDFSNVPKRSTGFEGIFDYSKKHARYKNNILTTKRTSRAFVKKTR